MTPLIDGDIILHELGWSGEFKDKETGEFILLGFDHVQELLDNKIKLICEEVEATSPPIIFLTDNEWLNEQTNKRAKFFGKPERPYIRNFRYDIGKTKPYKGTRKNPKPYHFYNIMVYLIANYQTIISDGGLEADDEMGIYQCSHENTIICSRDKDLRIIPGWHYSWECGQQRSIGPAETDKIGWLEKKDNGEVLGYGLSFFYYQMLVGDATDNIPGLPGSGKVGALKLLEGADTEQELFNRVKQAYINKVGLCNSKDYFMEQANLLWMRQERDKGYELPKG